MKKILSLIAMFLTIVFGAGAETVVKENHVFEKLTYQLKIDDNGNHYAILVSGDLSLSGTVKVPSNIVYEKNSYTVREIGNPTGSRVFHSLSQTPQVQQLVLPGTVTKINAHAFESVQSLKSVVFSGSCSLETIGDYAFSYCKNLETFGWMESANASNITIGEKAFFHCEKLNSIKLPTLLKSIGYSAFAYSGLQSIELKPHIESIGESAFYQCADLVSVNFWDSSANKLTEIPKNCFQCCEALKNCFLPNSVTTIGEGAFNDCISLGYMRIGSNVSNIGQHAFYRCTGLETLVFDSSDAITIGLGAFGGCTALKKLTLNAKIDHLMRPCGTEIFAGCTRLTDISFAENTGLLPESMFKDCTGLKNVDLSSVRGLSASIFQGCRALNQVKLPTSLLLIPASAFEGCQNLSSIDVSGIRTIATKAFKGCNALTNVTLCNNSELSIGESAFESCTGIESIIIPNATTANAIGTNAFYGCSNLKFVNNKSRSFTVTKGATTNGYVGYYANVVVNNGTVSGTNDYYESSTGFVYGDAAHKILSGYLGTNATITIPSTVEAIRAEAFAGNTTITSVVLPRALRAIGDNAFKGCTSLTAVTGDGTLYVQTIGDGAFEGCSQLALFGSSGCTLPASALATSDAYIGSRAFKGCKFVVLILNKSNPTGAAIYDYAFEDCKNLQVVIVNSMSNQEDLPVDILSKGMFKGCLALSSTKWSNTKVFALDATNGTTIPDECFEYAAIRSLKGLENIEVIGEKAFKNCTYLKANIVNGNEDNSITFNRIKEIKSEAFAGSGVEKIFSTSSTPAVCGNRAFINCNSLTTVQLPVKEIGNNVFEWCEALTTFVDLSGLLESIGHFAFHNCKLLTAFDLSNNTTLTTIGKGAFLNCGSLTEIHIPAQVTEIRPETFDMHSLPNSALQSVTIHGNIEKIGEKAFWGCGALSSINLPNSLVEVGDYAFSGCGRLELSTLPKSLEKLGEYAFERCNSIETLTLPDNIETIPEGAFSECYSLEEVTIGQGTKTIGDNAFFLCDALKVVYTGDALKSIGNYAFAYCEALKDFYITACNWIVELGSDDPFEGLDEGPDAGWVHIPNFLGSGYADWSDHFCAVSCTPKYYLTDGEPYRRTELARQAAVEYTRTFTVKAGKSITWQPMYVPFYLVYDEWKDLGEIAEIGGVHNMTNDNGQAYQLVEFLTLKPGDRMKANTPYVFLPKEELFDEQADGSRTATITFKSDETKLLPADNGSVWCASTRHNYYLIGVYEQTEIHNCYGMANGGFNNLTKITTLAPYRFYLTLEAANHGYDPDEYEEYFDDRVDEGGYEAPARIGIMVDGVVVEDGDATEIKQFFVTPKLNDGKRYNLYGMPVGDDYKGIVVVNGKKMLVK